MTFRVKLLNPNDPNLCGAVLSVRDPSVVKQGILRGWTVDAAKVLMQPPRAPELIEQAQWTPQDAQFLRSLVHCRTPEQVEATMPRKWLAYDADVDWDSSLARVCRLCTALVEKYLQWSDPSKPAQHPKTTAEWRMRAQLQTRIESVVSILENALGATITLHSFLGTDGGAKLLERCWASLDEDAQVGLEAALRSDAIGNTDPSETDASSNVSESHENGESRSHSHAA